MNLHWRTVGNDETGCATTEQNGVMSPNLYIFMSTGNIHLIWKSNQKKVNFFKNKYKMRNNGQYMIR